MGLYPSVYILLCLLWKDIFKLLGFIFHSINCLILKFENLRVDLCLICIYRQ